MNADGVLRRYVDMLLNDPDLVIEHTELVYEPNVYHPSHDKAGPTIGPEPKLIVQFRKKGPTDWKPDATCRLEIVEDGHWSDLRMCRCSLCGAEFMMGEGASAEWLKAENHYCHGCGRRVSDVVLIEPEPPEEDVDDEQAR